MFEGLLPPDIGAYATTASNAMESSWGTYCPGRPGMETERLAVVEVTTTNPASFLCFTSASSWSRVCRHVSRPSPAVLHLPG